MSHSIPGLHCAGRLRVSILITSIIFAIIKISKRLASISKGEYDIGIHFFPREHGNEFSDLIGSLAYAVRIFLSVPTGTVTLTWVLVLLFTRPFKCKCVLAKLLFIREESWKTYAFELFKTDLYYNIWLRKFLFSTSVSLLHFQSAVFLCEWKWKNEKNWVERVRKRRLSAGLGLQPRAAFSRPRSKFSIMDLPCSRQITYIHSILLEITNDPLNLISFQKCD